MIFLCPHCTEYLSINEEDIACAIFRHGHYLSNYQQINPHASKEECESLLAQGKIAGCGKPFKLYRELDVWNIAVCDYI